MDVSRGMKKVEYLVKWKEERSVAKKDSTYGMNWVTTKV